MKRLLFILLPVVIALNSCATVKFTKIYDFNISKGTAIGFESSGDVIRAGDLKIGLIQNGFNLVENTDRKVVDGVTTNYYNCRYVIRAFLGGDNVVTGFSNGYGGYVGSSKVEKVLIEVIDLDLNKSVLIYSWSGNIFDDSWNPNDFIKRFIAITKESENIDSIASTCFLEEENAIAFQDTEVKPSYNGGDANQFSLWVNNQLTYPKEALKKKIQGTVFTRFTIEPDGEVSNVQVLKGVDPSLDKEAVRVISSSPRWSPGFVDGKAVRVTYTFPVIFMLK